MKNTDTYKPLIGRTVRFNGYEGKVVKVSEDALTLRRITPGIDGPIAMEFEAPIRNVNAWRIIK